MTFALRTFFALLSWRLQHKLFSISWSQTFSKNKLTRRFRAKEIFLFSPRLTQAHNMLLSFLPPFPPKKTLYKQILFQIRINFVGSSPFRFSRLCGERNCFPQSLQKIAFGSSLN